MMKRFFGILAAYCWGWGRVLLSSGIIAFKYD